MKKEKVYTTENQSVKLAPLKTDGFILDLGGGGEGIIGKLNGKQVIAIDTSREELQETRNEALKVIMDATDLRFLPKTFDICTSFFSLMYIPNEKHMKVFQEAHRVLKDNGRFLIWDVGIPEKHREHGVFVVDLEIRLPNAEIETKYGVKWNKKQGIRYFKEIAQKAKFKITNEWSKPEILFLELTKSV